MDDIDSGFGRESTPIVSPIEQDNDEDDREGDNTKDDTLPLFEE